MAQAQQINDEEEEAEQRAARTRSPAYPGINLEAAIKRTRELYTQDKMNPVPLQIIVKRWGYKPKSSAGLITAAALKSFGLVRDTGTGSERKLQVTEQAHNIFLDTRQESLERDQLIKDAALRPKIHNTLWKKWGTDLPSDETLDHALKADWGFNPNSVSDFIKEYKDTIRFAKLTKHDSLSSSDGDKESIKVDDYVQWESSGGIQFEAKKITGFSGDGAFAFVEGTSTGLPIKELSKVQVPDQILDKGKVTQPIKYPARAGMNNDTFTLDEGQVVLQWPAKMSPESYEDFKSWLDLVARKAKRAVDKKESGEDLI